MKKYLPVFLTTIAIVSLLIIPSLAFAQQPISGDQLCGASKDDVCGPQHLKELARRVVTSFVAIGGALLVTIIAVRLVVSYFAYARGDAGAIKRAGEDAFNAALGFLLIFAVFGGLFLAMLTAFGAQPWVVQLLKLFADGFVETAYAQGLPNMLGSNGIFDIILSFVRLIIQFFIIPGLVAMWVWSGFLFVYARGNPEGLKKAKSLLLWAVIFTVVIVSLQGFLLAFKNTAESLAPGIASPSSTPAPAPNSQSPSPASPTGTSPAPATGTSCDKSECEKMTDDTARRTCFSNRKVGSCCLIGGFYGQVGPSGECSYGGSR